MRFLRLLILLMLTAACGDASGDGRVAVAFIGNGESALQSGLRLSPAGQHVRAATAEGLVTLNARGEVVPAMAERWIVTDDGQNYIFRLRRSIWPSGADITSQSVSDRLTQMIGALEGTSLGRDLYIIDEIVPRTGLVVEFQLHSPMPDFLQLLAQPELGLIQNNLGIGPMSASREDPDNASAIALEALAPETRGLPQTEDWAEDFTPVSLRVVDGGQALEMFEDAAVDLVLNGQIAHLPLVDTGPLARGTLRLDGTIGLFGLRIRNSNRFLETPENREALAMTIDRSTLLQSFNLGGWLQNTRIVPDAVRRGDGPPERWAGLSLEQRIATARSRVNAWQASNGAARPIRIQLPEGPGTDRLLLEIARAWDAIGIEVVRAGKNVTPDMVLLDRTARYGNTRWFLNQFACGLKNGLCSPEADALVSEALYLTNSAERSQKLLEAEEALLAENAFIPFGAPIRWSLVRGDITGFSENVWGLHPLFPLSQRPI